MFTKYSSRVAASFVLLICAVAGAAQNPAGTASERSRIAASYGQLPLSFEANRGQSDRQVKFLARGSGYGVFLTSREAVLALQGAASGRSGRKTDLLRMQLIGANESVEPQGADPLPGMVNYFRGNDPSRWHSGVPTFAKVKFAGVYPGVDLVYYGNQGRLEYDFVVAANADPENIRLHFAGAGRLHLSSSGDLSVEAKNGRILFQRPVIYQEENGGRRPVEGWFKLLADKSVGFALGDYDHGRSLVIDPVLVYSTYLGGTRQDEADAIALDESGFAYIAGSTQSPDFPVTAGAFQTSGPSNNVTSAFVTKLNKAGTALVYSTYLEGGSGAVADALTVDGFGNVYVAGTTSSADFPVTPGAFQTTNPGGRAFVTKLNPTGTALVYSTYLGGSFRDLVKGIVVDVSGSAYVAGTTSSFNFPTTPGAFQSCSNVSHAAFVSKLHPDGTSLDYSTCLAGTGQDDATGLALGRNGNAYVTGYTVSSDFPVTSAAFQKTQHSAGSANGFVTELNADGTALVYSTYLGGSVDDEAHAIALDASGNAWITGYSASTDFPITAGAFQSSQGAVFVSKLKADGTSLVYSTFLGEPEGRGSPRGNAIAVDQSGDIIIAGSAGPNFPVTPGAFQTTGWAGASGFVTRLNAAGTALVTSTYLGGSVGAFVYALAIDPAGNAFVAGQTTSTDFPVSTGAFQTVKKDGRFDGTAFVTQLNTNATTLVSTTTTLTPNANPAQLGQNVVFDAAVDASSGNTTPTGNVVFTVDGTDVDTVALNNGAASYQTTTLTAGGHTIKAAYQGNSDFGPSSSTITENIQTPQTATPTFSPAPGTYTSVQSVTISDSTVGASIYFTTNGSTPTTASTKYTIPIAVTTTETIQAIATAEGHADSAVASATYTIQLSAVAGFTASSLEFGDQTTGTASAAKTVTLKNTGNATLTLTAFPITGSAYFSQTNNCGSSLAAGASCNVSVTFAPQALGAQAATLSITSNTSGTAPTVALTGTGTAPPAPLVTLTPPSLAFGNQTQGISSAAQSITVQNTGTAALTGITISVSESQPDVTRKVRPQAAITSTNYSATTTCGSSLDIGATCTVSVTFSPTTTGSLPGTLSISDNAANSPQTASLSGTGGAIPDGVFTIASSPTSATIAGGGSAVFHLTVGTSGGPYNHAITLSASGLPTGATATFSPSSVNPGSSTATSDLTIQTAASSAANRTPKRIWPIGSPVLAFLLFAIPRRLRKQWSKRAQLILLALASLGAAAIVTGCGGGFALPITSVTSTVTITATSGADVHTTTIQLTVN